MAVDPSKLVVVMALGNAQSQPAGVPLGEAAPRVRVTSGTGTAAQKTWNLRRPVTVIGSQRQAQIVLRDEAISKSHCAIVNDGRTVLLCDLHSSTGTRCNEQPVSTALLNDGDVVQIGPMSIQVAINSRKRTDESLSGWTFNDPLKQPEPLNLQIAPASGGAARSVRIEQSVAVIGRAPSAAIHLDHADVSLAHALIFVHHGRPVIYDLGSRKGLLINGQKQTSAPLADGDRLTIGPFDVVVRVAASQRSAARADTRPASRAPNSAPPNSGQTLLEVPQPAAKPQELVAADQRRERELKSNAAYQAEAERRLVQRQAELDALAESLKQQREHLEAAAAALDERRRILDERAAQLDARQLRLEQRERRPAEVEAFNGPRGCLRVHN